MDNIYTALGLMSGTSGDGVDSSVIQSDGKDQILIKQNKFDTYPSDLSNKIHRIKEKIENQRDLSHFSNEIKILEDNLTNFHAGVAKKCLEKTKVDIIGFHGQTIFHNSEQKISKQLGSGEKLSQLTNKTVVYNF